MIPIELKKKYYTGRQVFDVISEFVTDSKTQLDALNRLASLPSADVVEIVRCKDCIHSQYDYVFHERWCEGDPVGDYFYCGKGERKKDG